jgi:hypothetical protein
MSDAMAELHGEFARYQAGLLPNTTVRPQLAAPASLGQRVVSLWRVHVTQRATTRLRGDDLQKKAVSIVAGQTSAECKWRLLPKLSLMATRSRWTRLTHPQREDVAEVYAAAADFYLGDAPSPRRGAVAADLLGRAVAYAPRNVSHWIALSEVLAGKVSHGAATPVDVAAAEGAHMKTLARAHQRRRGLGDRRPTPRPGDRLPFYPELGAAFYASYIQTFRPSRDAATVESVNRAALMLAVLDPTDECGLVADLCRERRLRIPLRC